MEHLQYVWVIYRKDKPKLYIDVNDIEKTVDAINKNDFIYLKNYHCTLHKFDVDEIKVERLTTQMMKEIQWYSKRLDISNEKKQALSFDQYFQWLATQTSNYLSEK